MSTTCAVKTYRNNYTKWFDLACLDNVHGNIMRLFFYLKEQNSVTFDQNDVKTFFTGGATGVAIPPLPQWSEKE